MTLAVDPAWLREQRWFAGKHRGIGGIEARAAAQVGESRLELVEVEDDAGASAWYALPSGPLGPLVRAFESLAHGGAGPSCRELCATGFAWRPSGAERLPEGAEEPIGRDQSNTSSVLAGRAVLKCYRRLWPGPHPEVELVSWLGSRLAAVPRALGSLVHLDPDGVERTVLLAQAHVPAAEDGWAWAARLLERGDAGWGAELGEATAELHRALAAAAGPELAPRRAGADDLAAWHARAERGLAEALAGAPAEAGPFEAAVRRELAGLLGAGTPLVTRVHGDYHVGQVLRSPAGLRLIDFEGEPTRPAAERRLLESPLRDVASLLRSFDHVPRWFLRDDPAELPRGLGWARETRRRFLAAYRDGIEGTPLAFDERLLRAFEVEKEVYELVYAASFLPEWTPVAAASLAELLGGLAGRGQTPTPDP